MATVDDYFRLAIPRALKNKIQKYIDENPDLGYKTVPEFVKDVIRQELKRVEEKFTLQNRVKELERILEERMRT